MRNRILPRLNNQQVTPSVPGLAGSTRAARFLKDVKSGTDSVDIIVIGDSNAGSPGGYGYTRGIHRVLSYQHGVEVYATSLMSGGSYLASSSFSGITDGMIMTGHSLITNNDNAVGGTGSTTNSRNMTVYALDSEINALVAFLGFSSTNYTNDGLTMLPKVNAWQWTPVVVPSAGLFVGAGGTTNAIWLNTDSPLTYGLNGNGSVACQYRTVVGTFNASGGQFKLSVFNKTGFTLNARSASFISTQTNGGGYGYKTATIDFTTATPAGTGVYCSWDGANQGSSNGCTGPFACLWHSIIATNRKGYSVSNLIYHGGATGTMLADRIEGMDKNLDAYLGEIRARQIAAGGSGRAIVWVNYGINTDSTPSVTAAWTNAADRIKARIQQRWVAAGGSVGNLAFVFSVSHPVPTGTVTPWDANRASVSAAATAWGQTYAGDGSGTCVTDIEVPFNSTKLTKGPAPSGSLYDSGGQGHLNATTSSGLNGYDAVAGAVLNTLISAS